MSRKCIVIFGGSVFIGRYLVKSLLGSDLDIRVAALHGGKIDGIDPSRVQSLQCDIKDKSSVLQAMNGANYAVNLVGLRFEVGDNNFENVHVNGACNIASAAKECGIERLIHLSILTSDTKSRYGETKLRAQQKVLEIFPNATVIRPSLIYGKEGKFINIYAKLAKNAPFIPLTLGGHTKTQPLYIEDVAKFIHAVIDAEDKAVIGKVLNIAGPKQYEMREIAEFVLSYYNIKKNVVPLPRIIAWIIGFICEIFSIKLITRDMITLMKTDLVLLEHELNSMESFGIKPISIEEIIPTYLH